MEAVIDRYLSMRRLTDQPTTVEKTGRGLHKFVDWLAQAYPQIESWCDVTRDQVVRRMAPVKDALPSLWPFVLEVIDRFCASGSIRGAKAE